MHLTEQRTGSRTFVRGTLAVGAFVLEEVRAADELQVVDGFLHELARHG